MIKKAPFLLLLFFLTYFTSLSQSNKLSIKGKIIDKENRPIELATVFLLNKIDSSFIQSVSSDENGNFIFINLSSAEYLIQISFIGYKKIAVPIKAIDRENIIPFIILEIDEKILNEVTINSNKHIIEKKIDRIVFNIENSPTLSGSTAWDALSKSPGVIVDQQGNISIVGKQGAMIYIDNKPMQLSAEDVSNLLKSMSADDLSKIEIITNPSAKYDAQGGAGIINLQTKKNKTEGLNGSARLGYEHWFYPKYNGGINLNFRNKKINIYTNYNYRFQKAFRRDYATIYYPSIIFDEVDSIIMIQQPHTYKLGGDYYFGKNIIGAVIDGFFIPRSNDLHAVVNLINPSGDLTSYFLTQNKNTLPYNQFATNFNYKRIIESGKKELNIDIDYNYLIGHPTLSSLTYQYDTKNTPIGEPIQNRSDNTQQIKISSIKLDYFSPFLKGKLEWGGKINAIQADNTYLFENQVNGIYQNDTTKSNRFLYTENTQAIYTSFSQEINKINFQIGLRGEHTQSIANSVTLKNEYAKDYFMLFPTAYIQYISTQDHDWSFSYGRRVTRPRYQALNPFRVYTNPYIYMTGNLFLVPYFTHLAELTYTYNQKYIFSFYFQQVKNGISETAYQDNKTKIISYSTTNLASELEYGLSCIIPFDIISWWSINFNGTLFRQREASTYLNTDFVFTRWSYTGTMTQSFTISKKHNWKGEIIANYTSPTISGIFQYRYKANVSIGIQKKILANNGTISLNISDLFYTNWYGVNIDYLDQHNSFLLKFESRVVRINFTYNFGKKTVKGFRNRNMGNEEERNRG